MKCPSLAVLVLSFSLSLKPAFGTTSSGQQRCHDGFVGTVTSIVDAGTPFSSQSPQKVSITFNLQDGGQKTIETLKYGPTTFEVGEEYQVDMREQWLCSVSKLSGSS